MDPGPPPTSFQKQKAWLLFLGVSVLNPYIAAAILSVTALFGAGRTRRRSLYGGESGERRAHGDSRHYLVVVWIMSIARLAEANEA